jgi:hypothetical protein
MICSFADFIGGGIGVISAELAASNIACATLVEASPAYLEVALREPESRYASCPTQFLLGDFAVISNTLANADVMTLDRVVCSIPMLRRCSSERQHEHATARVHVSKGLEGLPGVVVIPSLMPFLSPVLLQA